MAGNIGDQDAKVLLVDLNEIVKIAGDRSHRQVTCCDRKSWYLGKRVRKDGKLNLASHFEFIIESKELCGQLRTGLAKEDVTTDASIDDGGRKRLVHIVDRTDFETASLVIGARLAGQKNDRNFSSNGVCL